MDVVCKLLEKNKEKRLGSKNDVHEVLSHPWFADIDIKTIEAQKIEPPLKPDFKDKATEFKYFNTKQQSLVDSIMPKEKIDKIHKYEDKFKDFDTIPGMANN